MQNIWSETGPFICAAIHAEDNAQRRLILYEIRKYPRTRKYRTETVLIYLFLVSEVRKNKARRLTGKRLSYRIFPRFSEVARALRPRPSIW